jgi:cytochrome c-type biogenesis protein
LSIVAGVPSFFSPCAFPLLPGYFSLYYASVDEQAEASSSKFIFGLAAASGVVAFNLLLGLLIGILGTGFAQGLSITGEENNFIRIFRSLVGVILIVLGIAQVREVNLKPILADALAWRTRPGLNTDSQNPVVSLFLYGFGYNAAGMGCTAPILVGLLVFALSSGGFSSAMSAFVVFSLTMASLMVLVSLLVATSQASMIQKLKSATTRIKKVSSILLIAVGLFTIITSLDTTTFVQLLFP